jgi:cyclic beta-1,2-glucan synthetase
LWAHGISGDTPIVLVRIDEVEDVEIVRQLLRAHEYWRLRQLAVDLVILNDRAPSYVQDLQTLLETVVRTSPAQAHGRTTRGGVFIVRADLMTVSQRDVLLAVARAVLLSRRGTLAEQVVRAERADTIPRSVPRAMPKGADLASPPAAPADLEFFNGLGGFADEGREYVVTLDAERSTPAPWINVVANADFGFQVSESGSGYTWSVNSRENQLTAWSNDPVSDPAGEILYIRDDETGELWTPTAHPIRHEKGTYVARHGQGYSRFIHESHGIALELLQLVALDDPVKIARLTLTNSSDRPRRLSVTAYVEWVLGAARTAAAPFVVTEIDPHTGAMLARNPWSLDFGARVAFADLGGRQTAWTADRTEFLGRHGSTRHPAALEGERALSGRVGTGLDPCGALQTSVELVPGERAEIVFLLGQAAARETAEQMIVRYRTCDVDLLLAEVVDHWDAVLGTVQVRTPDRSLDLLLNRWLIYQTLACRVWARSAFYQAGGAYGFRDQLQDVAALTLARPDVARAHILRSAARQFVEGDVQHWWHPPAGRGVRTRIADDRLWLPYVVRRYLDVTDDRGVLDDVVPFLAAPPLAAGQAEAYFAPRRAVDTGTLFEHCTRAIEQSLSVGSHGLPLMGTGDWNDGMNRVGIGGKGESVWLGWFLHTVLIEWAELAGERGERSRAAAWLGHAHALRAALERAGWDGDWYRRAYFDDGTPLGSATGDACRIDSIAQSWSVLSGAAVADRARRAMAAVEKHLVRRADQLVLLCAPPFDVTALDPGYIKGYPPGVRENGGQYTHAAIWSVMALAALGDGDKAGELFAMLNPIRHARTPASAARYRLEPYVVAADVYAEASHVGRGGWSWYTGSAGWMYRAGLESLLGFRVRGARLVLDPCIPRAWPTFSIAFRYRSARYEILVENPQGLSRGVSSVELDGVSLDGPADIGLADDGKAHRLRIVLGKS